MASKPARVRVSKGQSKHGCYTCRARRVKCDEAKPFCQRCMRAGRQCEGYSPQAYAPGGSAQDHDHPARQSISSDQTVDGSKQTLAPISNNSMLKLWQMLSPNPDVPREEVKLHADALMIMSKPTQGTFSFDRSVLTNVLWQATCDQRSTQAAFAALGAAAVHYQASSQQLVSGHNAALAQHYGRALALMRQSLSLRNYGDMSILQNCMVLAVVEFILRRFQSGFMHLRAAYSFFQSSDTAHLWRDPQIAQDLRLLFQALDIQVLALADFAVPPMVPPVAYACVVKIDVDEMGSLVALDKTVVETTHAASSFLSTEMFAIFQDQHRPDLSVEQGKLVAALRSCVELIDQFWASGLPATVTVHLRTMRALCLFLAIEVATLVAETETVFDAYAADFRRMVVDCEEILRTPKSDPRSVDPFASRSQLKPYLSYVGAKYRDSFWRRRAAAAIREAERQEPWMLSIRAEAIGHCVAIEEGLANSQHVANLPMNPRGVMSSDPGSIDETRRVCIARCWTQEQSSGLTMGIATPLTGTATSTVRHVCLCQRVRPASSVFARVVASSHYPRHVRSGTLPLRQLDPTVWRQWFVEVHSSSKLSQDRSYALRNK